MSVNESSGYKHYQQLAIQLRLLAQGTPRDSIESRCYRHILNRKTYFHPKMFPKKALRRKLGYRHALPEAQFLEAKAEELVKSQRYNLSRILLF